MAAWAALENAVPTAILASQLQTASEKFHSLPLEGLDGKEIPSAMVVRHALWAKAVHIIDRVAEAEVAPLDIEFQQI